MTKQLLSVVALALSAAGSFAASPEAKPVELVLEDQFERRQDLAAYRGEVVVLVYGARRAPVAALQGVAAGKRSPDVVVVPVAAAGSVPGVIKDLIRTQVAKASPEVPVWLDFTGVMEKEFGLRGGQPNVVVFDAGGRLRLKVNGTPDQPTLDKLIQTIQNLRAEAVGLGK